MTEQSRTSRMIDASTGSLSWADKIARRLLLRALESLRVGRLTITDGDQVYRFGGREAGPHGQIQVLDPGFYSAVLTSGTVGGGESYMQRFWDTPDLVAVVQVMSANINATNDLDSGWTNFRSLALKAFHWLRANTVKGSKKNIAAHYDLGNDFFPLFLDSTMMYSSAVFEREDMSLQEASEAKLHRICKRLNLSEQDHLLEIGTGWGGMAIYAARHFGCKVTTTTISKEQFDYASAWVSREGLQDKVTLLLEDYRNLSGQYDKLVSIEMIEAVGHDYYDEYFATCSRLLKPEGLMLIQAITIADQRYDYARKHVDFIQRYIFPGGALPSVSVVCDCLRRATDMQLVGLEEIGQHYARTLAEWRSRFWHAIDKVRACGFDDRFVRMWDYYLAYCEGGFRERVIGTSQLLMAKPGARALPDPLPL
ncbi:SAM-dependent methyltransferase [Simiduia agarivorans]|uniref:Cyclopropane-fatty-acyl-phospholipid synthase n=1 Tax=Simiduia agarivorans (strain DSM 21679 / JCM 13881 / BCRC 17597 / SA1) TaxID=1117647 RepID=K4KKM9_SIMAS|nr:cyclopropane-fatty-acyl-phospholipid synthase family protein [Simiduia agarivorans]AFU98775.1 cyclopropane-fatty-acyl-phospholipid synthase [Simiduia agarivorans SA1 = DSM 21679]